MFTRMGAKIAIDRKRIAELCRRHHIRRLALFGSVLTDDFRPDSDVDVLVDFEPDQVIGFRIFDIEEELSQILGGHWIDLIREKYLNRRLRKRVLASAETHYAEVRVMGEWVEKAENDLKNAGHTLIPAPGTGLAARRQPALHVGGMPYYLGSQWIGVTASRSIPTCWWASPS